MTTPPRSGTVLIAGGGTGGHLMPALAIAGALRQAHPGRRVALVGASRGVEATLLLTRDFPFHLLPAEPLYRKQWWKNVRWPFLLGRLIRAADQLLDEENPSVVIGTGGYASGPVVWRAGIRGIPTAIQEQNAYPGLASRWLAGRVREIWLGVPEAAQMLKLGAQTEVIDTGNPIEPPDEARRARAMAALGLDSSKPVLLVTGGSQGSLAINEAVAGWLERGGGSGVQILWAAGTGTVERFRKYHRPPFVQLFGFLDPIADAFAVADLAISRAGMMTIASLAAWGIPSVLIPLPTAAADHQTPNAKVMAEAGAGIHLPQAELSAERLGDMVDSLFADRGSLARMAQSALRRGKPGAAAQIAERVVALAGE